MNRIQRAGVSFVVAVVGLTGAALPSSAAEIAVDDLSAVDGLSAAQLEAIADFASGPSEVRSRHAASRGAGLNASGSTRATYYRGSVLMWARDSVDFGYNGSSVTWTSAYQQAGSIFPNIARNLGISRYYNTTYNDRFRAGNRIGAGIVTPWGDVTVYTSDYIHRLSVNGSGGWSAWSD